MDNSKKKNSTEACNKSNRTEFGNDFTDCNNTSNNTNQKSDKNSK